jgi:nucleotide-binding universal stress UspA family protein
MSIASLPFDNLNNLLENEHPAPVNLNLQNIMIAIDDSKESEYAVKWAAKHFIKLRDIENQKVILFTCQQSHPNIKLLKEKIPFFDEIEKKIYEQNCAYLRKQRQILLKSFPRAEIELIVSHGKDAGEEIVDYAFKNNLEAVIMGAKKVTKVKALKRVFLGSIGHKVAHMVHCPIVMIKHP